MKTDFALRGWIRASTRKSENAQREALAAVGCTTLYVHGDDTPDDLVRDLRQGDKACMTTLARISSTRKDIEPFRKAVHAKGAVIWELETNRRSDNADDMSAMWADAVSELTGEARGLTPAQAKRNGSKGGKIKGKRAAERRTSITEAKSVWYDPGAGTVRERLARPEMRGWTLASAYRHLKTTVQIVRGGAPRLDKNGEPRVRYVYFIQRGRTKNVKIGSAYDVKSRFQSLRTSSPDHLRLIAYVEGDKHTEAELHERFKKQWVRREWFKLEGDLAKFIAKLPKPETR